MNINITIWRTTTKSGYDHGPYINTVHARYPDRNRLPGEPHDIQEYHEVRAIEVRDENALNHLGQRGARTFLPDYDAIEAIIEIYRGLGNVIVSDNNHYK